MRSNHTTKDVLNFLIDLKKENKLPNLRVVLNGVEQALHTDINMGINMGINMDIIMDTVWL